MSWDSLSGRNAVHTYDNVKAVYAAARSAGNAHIVVFVRSRFRVRRTAIHGMPAVVFYNGRGTGADPSIVHITLAEVERYLARHYRPVEELRHLYTQPSGASTW